MPESNDVTVCVFRRQAGLHLLSFPRPGKITECFLVVQVLVSAA